MHQISSSVLSKSPTKARKRYIIIPKKFVKNIVFICTVLSWMFIGLMGISEAVLQTSPSGECQMASEKYSILLDGVDYYNVSNSTTLRYVISIEPGTCGIDSWTLYLYDCIKNSDVISVSPPNWEFIQPDSKSGQTGVRFYCNINPVLAGEANVQFICSIELKGKWSAEETPATTSLISYNSNSCLKTVRGPSCR
jgi:hypothetical protein